MSADLHDLLDRGVPRDLDGPDTDRLVLRGTRRRHTKRAGAGVLAAVVLLGGGVVLGDQFGPGTVPVIGEDTDGGSSTWQELPDAPIVGRERPHVSVEGDRVLLWGGESSDPEVVGTDANGTYHSEVHLQDGAVYDHGTRSWTQVPEPPIALRDTPHVLLRGDTVVLWGGRGLEPVGRGGVHVPAAEIARWSENLLPSVGAHLTDGAVYDINTGEWRSVPPAPLASRWAPVVDWDGETLLVWGGEGDGGTALVDGATWSAATGWRQMADFPLEPRLGSARAWDDDRLVVWGGGTNLQPEQGAEDLVSDGAAYDRTTDTWTTLPPVDLAPRWFSYGEGGGERAMLDGDRVLIVGGATTTPPTYFRDGAWLDLVTGEWTPTAPAPADAHHTSADRHGAVAYSEDDGRVWLYDPDGDTWAGAQLPLPAVATGTADRRVFAREGLAVPEDPDAGWQPVAVARPDGSVLAPAIDADGTVRSWNAVAALDTGVLVWGGSVEEPTRDGGWTGTGHAAEGWFLPLR